MTVPDRLLYHTPGACSRVVLNALEEIGVPYREQAVSLMTGQQRTPAFLALNPKGKVPMLVEQGRVITELPVILYHLADVHPEAALLPMGRDGAPRLEALSDLVWLSSAVHPAASRLMRPQALSASDPEGVRAAALATLSEQATVASSRLSDGAWWYGDDWSITDVLCAWAFGVARQFGFPLQDHPELCALQERVEARHSFGKARALERAVAAREGMGTPPGLTL